MIHKLFELNQKKHMLIGASLIRIAFGFIIVYNYAIHYAQRSFLWGQDGVLGSSQNSLSNFSLYNLSASPLYFEVIYHIGLLAALAFLFGYKGKLSSILNFIFTWSLLMRNSIISDGGDNIIRILLLYLILTSNTAYFSVDAYVKRKRTAPERNDSPSFSLRNCIHNLAILACLVQVSMLYLTSGSHKAMGELWQNGTALYYILQVEEYTHPFFRDLLLSSDFLMVVGAYITIFAQLAFPFLLFNRYTKYIGMFGVIAMHAGIAVVMGLFSFSFIMIANQLLFLTDKEYSSLFSFAKQKKSKLAEVMKKRKSMPVLDTQNAADTLRPIIVFYDGWCGFCINSIGKFKRLDTFRRIEFLSFRDEAVIRQYRLDPLSVEKRMHSMRTADSRMERGIHSINRICKNIPILWAAVPFISLIASIGMGQPLYDFIASRRTIFPTGGCDTENGCQIPQQK